jgi:hypothetical protein
MGSRVSGRRPWDEPRITPLRLLYWIVSLVVLSMICAAYALILTHGGAIGLVEQALR